MSELQAAFDREMVKQGRSVAKTPNGSYEDYASAVMWSWAQWGWGERGKEIIRVFT